MHSEVHLYLIVGKAASVVRRRFETWHAQRSVSSSSESRQGQGFTVRGDDGITCSAEQWPPETGDAVDRFLAELWAHRNELPVLEFRRYSDRWSMTPDFLTEFPEETPFVLTDGDTALCYGLRDGGLLAKSLRKRVRQRGGSEELRRFELFLAEIVSLGNALDGDRCLVLRISVVAGLTLDREVEAALDEVPEWLANEH